MYRYFCVKRRLLYLHIPGKQCSIVWMLGLIFDRIKDIVDKGELDILYERHNKFLPKKIDCINCLTIGQSTKFLEISNNVHMFKKLFYMHFSKKKNGKKLELPTQ